jgi:hypothetical protein
VVIKASKKPITLARTAPALPKRGPAPALKPVKPIKAAGYVPPTRFVHPTAPISTRNYPRPQSGNTYITNNTTIINNNYNYDSHHYQPHVANFYGSQSPLWGDHWRYGCAPSPTFSVSVGGGGFGFGFYVYTPYYAPCVASPYYYDPYVPAYVPEDRVSVWSGYNCNWDDGDAYNYDPTVAYDGYGDPSLNYGISNIVVCYQSRSVGLVTNFMGDGQVAIFSGGHYMYSVEAGDFGHMMADNCRACPTVGFDVIGVRHRGEYAWVRCRHRFRWHDGSVHGSYMIYHMQHVHDRYAVIDFSTSNQPF